MQYSIFSQLTKNSQGRFHKEKEDRNRTIYMRDRDRIIHSTSFRRLKYKTQVFVHHEGDYYRTRLSHSIEVSQLARSLSKLFRVNEDLSETIALAHDLGHTPFGHAGEEALNIKLKKKGGFNHNLHALKILTNLEQRYLNFDGLNLTWESLEGILKHNGPVKTTLPNFMEPILKKFNCNLKKSPSFEAQIASISDDIAYNNNDIDDGLHAKIFDLDEISEVQLVKEKLMKIKKKNLKLEKKRVQHELVRSLIKSMIDDLEKNTKKNLSLIKPKSCNEIKDYIGFVVSFSDEMIAKEDELRKFLKKKMYFNHSVKIMTYKAKKIVSDLFDLFLVEPQLLPDEWKKKLKQENDLEIVIGDYIASMTDKNAINIHEKYFNLYSF